MMCRTGLGWDQHMFTPGRPLILGGVVIPFDQGLKGHSDGDVVLHALADALLGAIGAGDIGSLFPPDDPQWEGVSSDRFVLHALEELKRTGYRIENVDLVMIAETPRLSKHIPAIRQHIAALLGIAEERVNVKAKSPETLGDIGRGRGIRALCLAHLTGAETST